MEQVLVDQQTYCEGLPCKGVVIPRKVCFAIPGRWLLWRWSSRRMQSIRRRNLRTLFGKRRGFLRFGTRRAGSAALGAAPLLPSQVAVMEVDKYRRTHAEAVARLMCIQRMRDSLVSHDRFVARRRRSKKKEGKEREKSVDKGLKGDGRSIGTGKTTKGLRRKRTLKIVAAKILRRGLEREKRAHMSGKESVHMYVRLQS